MVSSAIFGAAAGTGLALVVAMTIVVYRYYAVKRKGKYWSNLDRWPDPPTTKKYEGRPEEQSLQPLGASSSHVLDCWRKPQKNYYTVQTGEFNVTKEQHAVQPSSVVVESAGLPHQTRSYPGSTGRKMFTRNSSVSSQSSLEGGSSSHRGSSPQIRADGRYQNSLETASSYPPSRTSRSPSPGRAASLDARCGISASCSGSLSSNASPSSSISSLATSVSTYGCPSLTHGSRSTRRSLSPLLIPRSRNASEGGCKPPSSPFGTLEPDLYQPSGPIILSTRRNVKSLGQLRLQLKYDFNRSDLNVHLIEAHNLSTSDEGGFNEPYVKLTLSPEVDLKKRQTDNYHNKQNLRFDQQFKFPVSYDELQEKTLLLQVFDSERFSRNDVVGTVRVALDALAATTSPLEVLGEIEADRKPPEQIQEILLSLSYLPCAERLTVQILEARNLFPPQKKETLVSYVKVNLLCGEKKGKKKGQKTCTKETTSPVWNEAMWFKVPANSLSNYAIEVCVIDSSNDFVGDNAIVGSCIVGPAAGVMPGNKQWSHMTESPRDPISMWHTLH